MNTELSIIIPCYNSGAVLLEALQSIAQCNDEIKYKVIIVDDGSKDLETLRILKTLDGKFKVLYQENGGPAAARNYGIKNSVGKYILFLDSDNKIKSGFLDKAIKIFEANPEVGVVYSDVSFFGKSKKPRFIPEVYNIKKLLAQNYIDMCAIIRREVWEDVNGLDENRTIIGREDWDFWIRVGKTNWKFHFINEALYEYRISEASLINTIEQSVSSYQVRQYIYSKHIDLLSEFYPETYSAAEFYSNDKKRPFRSFIKFLYLKLKKS